MYVTVERVAVAWFIPLPYGNHQLGCIYRFADVCRESFEYLSLEVRQFC